MLKLSDINIEKLKKNKLESELPEFYELKNIVENNAWHINDSVFDHTVNVLEKLEELMNNAKYKIRIYLNEKIDNYSKKDILFLAALFHDIAKKETIKTGGAITSCPNHEEEGSHKCKAILSRFDLSEKEKDVIVRIVRYHGEIHAIVDPENERLEDQYKEFRTKYHDILLELILLAMADISGCQLNENDPDEFNFRMNFYQNVIYNY